MKTLKEMSLEELKKNYTIQYSNHNQCDYISVIPYNLTMDNIKEVKEILLLAIEEMKERNVKHYVVLLPYGYNIDGLRETNKLLIQENSFIYDEYSDKRIRIYQQ